MTDEEQFESSGKRMSFSYGTGRYSNRYVANRGQNFYILVESDKFGIKPGTEYPVIIVGQSGGEVYVKLVESMVNIDGTLIKNNSNAARIQESAATEVDRQTASAADLNALSYRFSKKSGKKR